jgi:two-component system, NarL family, sensor kinase
MSKEKLDAAPFIIIGITMLILIFVLFILSITVSYQKRNLAFDLALQDVKNTAEKAVLHSQLETQSQTLMEISQEIHDNLGQKISMARLYLNTVDVKNYEYTRQKIVATSELLAEVMVDIRELAHMLNSDRHQNFQLISQIEKSIHQLQTSGEIEATIEIEGDKLALPSNEEFMLFRIFQELVNNVIKHSLARSLRVRLISGEEKFKMTIHDDGKGFTNPRKNNADQTSGLENISRRARIIGAIVKIDTSTMGTIVSVEIPIKKDHNS